MIQTFFDTAHYALQNNHAAPVLVIGNFDGLHLGHQALIQHAKEIATRRQAPLMIMSFEPHPRRFFAPDTPDFRITTQSGKIHALDKLNVDFACILNFDVALAQKPAEDFLIKNIIQDLKPCHIMIGHDFCFGHKRQGNGEMLQKYGQTHGFDVTIFDAVRNDTGDIYASSMIRDDIRHGRLDDAAQKLGRRWEIVNPVIHGDKRGREIGFPTANQFLSPYVAPPFGIYATMAKFHNADDISLSHLSEPQRPDNGWHLAVTNIGIRPMFETDTPLVETYIFDFNQEIYDKTLRVCPFKFLRSELKFESVDALIEQIGQDCKDAHAYLMQYLQK